MAYSNACVDQAMERDALKHPVHPSVKDPEDLITWPDGTTCMRYELPEMGHMSDDYTVTQFSDRVDFTSDFPF